MPVPNPVMPVKGAGTTLWVYKGSGDPYSTLDSKNGSMLLIANT